MNATSASPRTFSRWLRSWPIPGQWAALVVLSSLVSLALSTAGLPAALLLGPMISAIVFGVNELHLPVPGWLYVAAQGVIGTMVAGTGGPGSRIGGWRPEELGTVRRLQHMLRYWHS